jgi:hypothetical protein
MNYMTYYPNYHQLQICLALKVGFAKTPVFRVNLKKF